MRALIKAPKPLNAEQLRAFRCLLLNLEQEHGIWSSTPAWYAAMYHEPPDWMRVGEWPRYRSCVAPEHRERLLHWAFERGYFDRDQLDRFMLDITLELLEP